MTTLQIRVNEKTKQSARRVFEKLGIDMSAGINLYLTEVSRRKGIPFLLTENGLTPQQERAILRASEDAKKGKNVSPPMTPKEAVAYLERLKRV